MAHYAKLDQNNRVIEVIVASQEFIDSGAAGDPAQFVQTSYNTQHGKHLLGGEPLRKNYAGAGMIYDSTLDAFYYPAPEDGTTWVLDTETCQWQRPVPQPDPSEPGRFVHWDETTQSWYENDQPYGA